MLVGSIFAGPDTLDASALRMARIIQSFSGNGEPLVFVGNAYNYEI